DDELRRLNRRSPLRTFVGRLVGDSKPEIRHAAADWQVEFLADPDGDINEGDLLVDSELLLPARPDLGIGERTRRITTIHTGDRTTTREQTVNRTAGTSASGVWARIVYDDDSGHHSYDVSRDSVTIGRGGTAYPVDLRIASSSDVSREHARIRRDQKS